MDVKSEREGWDESSDGGSAFVWGGVTNAVSATCTGLIPEVLTATPRQKHQMHLPAPPTIAVPGSTPHVSLTAFPSLNEMPPKMPPDATVAMKAALWPQFRVKEQLATPTAKGVTAHQSFPCNARLADDGQSRALVQDPNHSPPSGASMTFSLAILAHVIGWSVSSSRIHMQAVASKCREPAAALRAWSWSCPSPPLNLHWMCIMRLTACLEAARCTKVLLRRRP